MGNFSKSSRGGYVLLLLLLLGVVVGVIVFYMSGNFTGMPETDSQGRVMPWKKADNLIVKNQALEPTAEQVKISKDIYYGSDVREDTSDRGTVSLQINPDGSVFGRWAGTYRDGQVDYDVMGGDFAGNIAPSEEYLDENGSRDASKLYFITKGKFILLITDNKSGRVHQASGYIYVDGWIAKNYSVSGRLTIALSGKEYKIFTYTSAAPTKEDSKLPLIPSIR